MRTSDDTFLDQIAHICGSVGNRAFPAANPATHSCLVPPGRSKRCVRGTNGDRRQRSLLSASLTTRSSVPYVPLIGVTGIPARRALLEERLKARPGSDARPIPEALQRWRGGHPSAPTLIAATRRAPIARISARRYLRMLAPLFMPARRWGGTTLVESTRAAMSSNPPPDRQGRDRARAESECLEPSRGCNNTGHGSTGRSGRSRSFRRHLPACFLPRLEAGGLNKGPSSHQAFINCDSNVLGAREPLSRVLEFKTIGGPDFTVSEH